MKRSSWLAIAATLLLSGAAQAASANLVVNGSFEQGILGIGSFAGWQTSLGDASTFVDSSGQTGSLYGQASDGLWAAYFGSTAADGGATISQALATTVGQSYALTFDLANDNGGAAPGNGMVASLAGAPVLTFSNLANQGFVHQQYSFSASTTSTLLAFSGYNNQSYLELDNVAVAAVPEPASGAFLLLGLLSLGAALKARSRS